MHDNLCRSNVKYKDVANQRRRHLEFDVGDFVWVVLTNDHFPAGEYNKLSTRKIVPVEIIEKINPNVYRLKLPSHVRTVDVFNMKHLIPFYGDYSNDDDAGNSRMNFLYPRKNDANEQALEFMEKYEKLR